MREPLTHAEVQSVIRGRTIARRVPLYLHIWVHPDTFGEREAAVRELLARYPADIQLVSYRMPDRFRSPTSPAGYSWLPYANPFEGQDLALDAQIPLPDWDRLDEVLASFPDPNHDGLLRNAPPDDDRYRLAHWWFCLFERHWELRGMTNALTDYYEHPAEVHRLFRALTDFYVRIIERAAGEQRCHGIWTSDDLGTQTAPFFSPDIFREFFKPYYAEMIGRAHELRMDFWMHACGNVEPFIGEWIDVGLDVLHPIQKHTMDERRIAHE